jgi:hypothetical protein
MVGISAAIGARCRLADRDMEVHLDSAEQSVVSQWPLLQFPNSLIRTTAGQLPVEFIPLQMRLTSTPLGLIRIKDRDPSPATRIFMEHLRRARRRFGRTPDTSKHRPGESLPNRHRCDQNEGLPRQSELAPAKPVCQQKRVAGLGVAPELHPGTWSRPRANGLSGGHCDGSRLPGAQCALIREPYVGVGCRPVRPGRSGGRSAALPL